MNRGLKQELSKKKTALKVLLILYFIEKVPMLIDITIIP